MLWEILSKTKTTGTSEIINLLLKNREINQKEEFFSPTHPENISLKSLGINPTEVSLALERIRKAIKNKESTFIYGDYDADGISATAILWETLHFLGLNVLPFIPNRFEDGYGIKPGTVDQIYKKNPEVKLIITVDNGIVAYEGIKRAGELGIDVIVLDHHTKGKNDLSAVAIVHTTEISGAGIAWRFSQELLGKTNLNTLELAAIGTVADQMPLTGANRSIVKFGLADLSKTKRPGLRALFEESGLSLAGMIVKPLTTYEIGFIIAPRINAMGRLAHGLSSLRLLCTKDIKKAAQIAKEVSSVNTQRQGIVEEVTIAARQNIGNQKIIVVAGETYHEGVIGLAAGRLAEEFYRPAIVLSVKGEIAKASARSVSGFNIIEAIRSLESLYIEGGGHAMAAGFSIKTKNIAKFSEEIQKIGDKLLTDALMERKLKVDCELAFDQINFDLSGTLKKFEPFGLGNPTPTFMSAKVEVVDAKPVGREGKHLKLKLKQNSATFDAIYFNPPNAYSLKPSAYISVAYQVEENVWNSHTSLQLKIKDINIT